MSHHRYSEESRPLTSITATIVAGEPWTARFIANNNLRQHCHRLASAFHERHPLTDSIREPCRRLFTAIEQKCDLLTRSHPSDFQAVPVMLRIAAYSSLWIRQPETWHGDGSHEPRMVLRSLLNHLFAKWETPEFFDNAWLVKGSLIYLERSWYCFLARGHSLRKLRGMPPSITSRALHLAMKAPRTLTIRQALRWGQIRSLGGSPELLAAVLSSRMVDDLSNDAVWSPLFEKLTTATGFDAKHFGLIADTLLEVIRRESWQRAQILAGLPLRELLSHCRRYWRSIFKLAGMDQPDSSRKDIHCPHLRYELQQLIAIQWTRLPRSRPFASTHTEGGQTLSCRIVELTHAWQLVAESRAMKHCVDTYSRSCKLGQCSIFSVRTEDVVEGKTVTTSHLTIEVYRQSRRIVQVRGRRNQYIHPQRIPLLRKWAGEMELRF